MVALLGLLFVWVIMRFCRFDNISNRQFNLNFLTESLHHEHVMRDESNSMIHHDDITQELKDQILHLYESDHNLTGVHSTTIAHLLHRYVGYEDTSQFLEEQPQILRYIFRNSS